MVVPTPAANLVLDVMGQLDDLSNFRADRLAVTLVFGIVHVLCGLHNLVRFSIGFPETWIVRIVVMKVEAEFVRQGF